MVFCSDSEIAQLKKKATPTPSKSNDAADAVYYSATDLEAFAQIMPTEPAHAAAAVEASATASPTSDRDVGPIRIVDFGKVQARSRHRRRAGALQIKIRYFD